MTLPALLLAAAEAHPCFTGCYSHEIPATMVVGPSVVETGIYAQCQDCLMFRVGALASLLPPGTTQYMLAQELGAHMRAVRSYRWAFSGYHATGPGFWLSAAYYGDGLFLVDGSRNHGGAKDVDLLVQAFRGRLAVPDDPGMLDPGLYAADVVHLSCTPPLGPVRTKQDILRLSQCSLAPRQGFRRVAIVEFIPLTSAAACGNGGGVISASSCTAGPTMVLTPPTSAASAKKGPPTWSAADIGRKCGACGRTVNELTILGRTTYSCMCC